MEEAAQEIEAIADWMQQLGGSTLDSFLVKHQFLSDLPDEYKSARQILESQDAKMGEIIIRLMEIELRFKESKNERGDDFAMQARDWMKTATCFNCGKKGHIVKYCDHGKEDSSNEDEKSRKAIKSWRKKIKKRAALMQLFSSDSESAAWEMRFREADPRENDSTRDREIGTPRSQHRVRMTDIEIETREDQTAW